MWFAISFTTLIALKEYFIHNSLDLNWDHPLLIKWIYWTSINCNLCTIYSQYLISFHWKFAISTKYIKKSLKWNWSIQNDWICCWSIKLKNELENLFKQCVFITVYCHPSAYRNWVLSRHRNLILALIKSGLANQYVYFIRVSGY